MVGMSRPPGAIPPPHPAGGVASGVGPNQGSGPPPVYRQDVMKQMMVMEQEKRAQMHMMEQQKQQLLREQRQQQQLLAEQVSLCSCHSVG